MNWQPHVKLQLLESSVHYTVRANCDLESRMLDRLAIMLEVWDAPYSLHTLLGRACNVYTRVALHVPRIIFKEIRDFMSSAH